MGVNAWQDRLYPDNRSRRPELRLFEAIDATAGPGSEVLELGAGAGEINVHDLRGRVKRMVGIDLSNRVTTNPLLDQGIIADATDQPFEDNSFDLVFALYVLEHIEDGPAFCREVVRVVRPGGSFIALTPNLYHYVPAISRLTPHRFHEWIGTRRGHHEEDVVPTFYRLNSRRALTTHLRAAGFDDVELTMIEVQPNYLLWSTPTFLLGAAYERLVNSTPALAGLRVNILVSARLHD
jgi:SAM-dependent methyltransferase